MSRIFKKKLMVFFLTGVMVFFVFTLMGCKKIRENEESKRTEDIVILYTNDIHASINKNIGMDGLAAYKQEKEANTPYVALVDCGDSVQGNYLSAASKGLLIIEAKNKVGYDYCILGNHEFDYKLEGTKAILEESTAQYLNCNITYTGNGENMLSKTTPYAIKDFGGTKVGFVGVTTPYTPSSSTPSYFEENGQQVYDFCRDGIGDALYLAVQNAVDSCRLEGAEFVVLLAHLGYFEEEVLYSSTNVIKNTTGIDVVLDGHSHSVIDGMEVTSKDNKTVILASTGTGMTNIGELIISSEGSITTSNISNYENKDETVKAWLENAEGVYEAFLSNKIATLDFDLSIKDEDGIRVVRSRETAIGDFCADAVRIVFNADIGMCNGGGIRASLEAGDIKLSDLINVHPFGNLNCVVKVTGAEVLDMLEYFYKDVQSEYVKNGEAYGESGSFMQISGLKVTVDTSIETPVEMDSNGNLTGFKEGARRVSEVYVLKNGEWELINPSFIYTLASSDYIIKNGGCGIGLLMKDHELLVDSAQPDYQTLIDYVEDNLDGDFSVYQEVAGRITIK